ncbi:MAG: hypothetical protein ACODAJ_05735 [Planctomycetota bacterium]
MHVDPIVEEVRAIRERQAARFDFNVRAIVEDAMKHQHERGHKVVSRPPRRPTVAEQRNS